MNGTLQTNTNEEMIAEGEHQEALRLARTRVCIYFGGLEQTLSVALERLDTTALETIVNDPSLVTELLTPDDTSSIRREGIIDDQGNPARIAPLGGHRNWSLMSH